MAWEVAFNSQMKSLGLTMASILRFKIRNATCDVRISLNGQWNLKLVSQFHVETNRKFIPFISFGCANAIRWSLLACCWLFIGLPSCECARRNRWLISMEFQCAADNSYSNNNFRFSIKFSKILQEQGHTLWRHGRRKYTWHTVAKQCEERLPIRFDWNGWVES